MSSVDKGTVCVTGGTGFIGSWLIMRLLDHGYSVRTTVRSSSPEKKRDLSFLTNLPGASENLEIFAADLTDSASFGAAIEGCVGVFHVASPMDLEGKEQRESVIARSVDGAVAILSACLNSKTVKRVVYTSSASAVVINGDGISGTHVMDESFWSDLELMRDPARIGGTYSLSKTLTEKAVLEFSEKNGLEVVTLIPSMVVGPFICPKFPGSVHTTLNFVFGKNDDVFGKLSDIDVVHVDDVARAHIFLFEHGEAKGRYNCTFKTTSVKSVAAFLGAKYPELNIPVEDSENEKPFKFPSLSPKKLLDSGFQFKHGVEEMFEDAIKCCKEKGHL